MSDRKTQKIMDLHIRGFHVECIQRLDSADHTPLRVYLIRDGRKQVGKFTCLVDVLAFVHNILKSGEWRTI